MAIRGVLFDFGNVLEKVDHRRLLENLARLCGRPPQDLQRRIYEGTTLSRDYESGLLSSAEFLEGVSVLCGTPIEEDAFRAAFNDIFTPLPGMSELVRNLKTRYRLGLVSNTNEWHFEGTIRHCEVFPLFDAVSLSYRVKAFKPDRRLLDNALAQLGLTPAECVFIDDLPENIAGAQAMGMHGIVFTRLDALMKALETLGVQAG